MTKTCRNQDTPRAAVSSAFAEASIPTCAHVGQCAPADLPKPLARKDTAGPTTALAIAPFAFAVGHEAQSAWAGNAIRSGRARLALQAIVAAAPYSGVAFHEGLLRILDIDGVPIAASRFIDAVEGSPLIIQLDCEVVRIAIDLLRRQPDLRLSINVSIRSLVCEVWQDVLEECLAPDPALAHRLILELTERSQLTDLTTVQAVMAHFRACGVSFALDDFGAGFTLLTHLRDLPFDWLKLDGRFTRNIETDATQRTFVRALSDLAQYFELPLVAECVETENEARAFAAMGITHIQGHVFGRPCINIFDASARASLPETASIGVYPPSQPQGHHP